MEKLKLSLILLLFSSQVGLCQCVTKVSNVMFHNVATRADGSISVWGWGAWGQLNNLTDIDEPQLTAFATGTEWSDVFAGSHNTFAIKNNGTLWASGRNESGQLGVGNTTTINSLVQIGNATNWKQISPSDYFTLGLKTNGTIWGWGFNDSYQVGDGSTITRLSPVQIGLASDWKMVGSSLTRSGFALKTNGTLWGWGLNIAGLLGDNLVTNRTSPVQHNSDTDWDKFELGDAHILALKTNGTLWAWGSGATGATGDGLPASFNRFLPRQIGSDTNWKEISAGGNFSMGIRTDGTLWAWGSNDFNQLGDGTTTNRALPTQIGNDNNWVSVSCGYRHTAAIKTDGSLWTWGSNDYGQLGNGSITPESTPTYLPVTGCTLATEDFTSQTNNLLLSPNPASSQLTLSYKGSQTVNAIVIYDFLGRKVYSSQPVAGQSFSATIPISQFEDGGYLMVLTNNGQAVVSKKWMKQ